MCKRSVFAKRFFFIFLPILSLIIHFGHPQFALADIWADEVFAVEFDVDVINENNYPENTTGEWDNKTMSLDADEWIILKFTDNIVINRPNFNDLRFHENGNMGESAHFWGKARLEDSWTDFGTDIGDYSVDLGDFGLSVVRYVKIDGTNTGSSPAYWGYDLDAVEALSSAEVPIPGTVLMLGSGLIGLITLRRKYRI